MASTPTPPTHAETPHSMRQLSNKRRPIAGFGDTRTGFWIGVSLAIHVALLLVTSIGFLRDVVDPAGAAARKEAAAAQAAGADPGAATAPAATPPGNSAATNSATPAAAPANASAAKPPANPPAVSEEKMMEERKNSAVVQRVTEKSKPSEVPAKPETDLLFEDSRPRR